MAFEQVAPPLELRVRRLLGATLALPVGYKVSLLLLRRTGELAAAFARTDAVDVAAPAAAAPDGSTPAAAAEATEAEAVAAAAAGEHALVAALRICSELALSRFESGAPPLHTHRTQPSPLSPTPSCTPVPWLPPPHTPPASASERCAGLRLRRAECTPRAAPPHAAAATGRPLGAARARRAVGAPRGAHGGAARR